MTSLICEYSAWNFNPACSFKLYDPVIVVDIAGNLQMNSQHICTSLGPTATHCWYLGASK